MSTLLLVEDDRDDADLTLLGFRQAGFPHEVVVARDGQEALDRLLDEGVPLPGAVLTDIKMPRLDGFDLLRSLKEKARLEAIPVVILTSSGDENDRAEARRLGATDYLRKPLDLSGYAEIVRRLRALMHAAAPPL